MEREIITKEAVRQVLHDFWQQYKRHPWRSLIAFFFPSFGTVFIFYVPPLILARIINIFAVQHSISLASISSYLVLFGVLWLFGEFLWRIGFFALAAVEEKGINALVKTAFDRLSNQDYAFYTNNFVGSLTKKALAFSRSFEVFTDTMAFNVVNQIVPIIFAIVVLARYSLWLPVILITSVLVVMLIAIPIIRKRSKLVAARHDASSRLSGRLSDALTNIIAIKSFAKENAEKAVYGEFADDYTTKFRKAADYHNLRLDAAISPFYVAANVLGLIAAIFFGSKLGWETGTIVVAFSYFSQTTRSFWQANQVYRNIESSISEAAEFTQTLLQPPTVQDTPGAGILKINKGGIEFENVNFKYGGEESDDELFLDGFNLEIKSNERVGLVGPSGGGKTTITKLILRFIDLQSGHITIDGQDISKVTQVSLREAVAYVPQEPILFHRSLFENIAYAKEGVSEEEVIKAAKLAHAHEFISELPKGYHTLVGERGVKLSGGQRQRIAIARALLKKGPILLLDEATSSLDSESEKYIQEGLWELMKGKTTLVIAHRLSTIKHLDRIIVLSEGKIVQDGTHEDLIKKKGLYAKLWSHQSGEFLVSK